jgi:DNA-binding NtrC family response regulator
VSYRDVVTKAAQEAGRQYLRGVLQQAGGNATKAAEIAELNRTDFYRVCRRIGLQLERTTNHGNRGRWHEQEM